ncbi:solute carrier family 25 (mitochondrial carnitine/acylcarnitine transporter), member 20/29 [Angomonas deanei]|uniref:Mitochondrial carrier protein, putative n=1 Tax=Angomonas deanei TaxID=59799 RepID=S9VHS1_9TRYP|nr:solute carrier family 25 (mitochondrial carnitine/acylcarnitine transporter), member 20/29 [Angomonas deanei]EPY42332.1 solute carrier family 25 (mitochondrial carnitine/acylcarnitine transporter), member 20/29 [Angomonas deanei]CAD2213304.1 Mitochondrial carrier protein, putative [Angomonas deanei]|eukprot:EPY26073.1 solute carrier family 25 (mitochondrial carnitine/acylcarnitine transporter), member 20/29 [Angomonas deanei]
MTTKDGLSEDQMRVLRRFIGGTVGGVLQAITAHPFDTIKSRVQNGVFPSISSCAKSTWQHEGLYGFYRGVTPLLVLNGIFNSILFSLNQFMMNFITPADFDHSTPQPLWRVAAAAQLTAPLYVLAITPAERVKVQLQVQGKGGAETEIKGPIACVQYILRTKGVLGLLEGYTPTLMSRLVGLPFYFSGYQMTRNTLLATPLASSNSAFREVAIPLAGGTVAGICFWTSNYPFDYVKTQVQASKTKVSPIQVAKDTFRKHGIKAFYKGYSACILRSIPANSSVWLGIELTNRFMTSNGW